MINYSTLATLFILSFIPSLCIADIIVGGEITYTVQKNDTLQLIGAKFGVDWKVIAKENDIDVKKHLQVGQSLRVNTRRIVPKVINNGIIINIPDRTLYFFKDGQLKSIYPVGLGMPSWRGITIWRTPVGKFKIIGKRKNPTWNVPESMQWKMQLEGKPVQKIVLPGPDNPLGRYAIDTTIASVVIHETIWPTTVYQFKSHGCVRMLPEHIEKFFYEVEINTSGEIIYEPVKLGISDNRIFLEIHRDIYGKIKDLRKKLKHLIEQRGVSDKVDWHKIEKLIREKSGIAEDITLQNY
ncbi:MAG: L,D-transpeptidase family protein [Thermodesulfovibrio sp.]|nr:L,D-transpeptidase family protein [Thermodesulfovibrio sp.]